MIQSIITIRNRDSARIENLITSLRSHGAETEFLVVDYGSDAEYAQRYRALADRGLFRLLRMETQGRPWNKCHAINAGVKATTAPWIATIDVDMVFDCNPFPYCLSHDPERKILVMQASWLPPSGDRSKAWFGSKGHPGGFVFQARTAFEAAAGYDERIQFWGLEDWDWPRRLERLGYVLEWLPEEYRFYHVWHPTVNNPTLRPLTASFDTAKVYFNNQVFPPPAADWGRPVLADDRPLLSHLGRALPVLRMEPSAWLNSFPELLSFLSKNPITKVEWGARIASRKLAAFKGFRGFFEALVAPLGFTLTEQVNQNFDYWYATRDSLTAAGVTDWYLSPALDFIVLYREA